MSQISLDDVKRILDGEFGIHCGFENLVDGGLALYVESSEAVHWAVDNTFVGRDGHRLQPNAVVAGPGFRDNTDRYLTIFADTATISVGLDDNTTSPIRVGEHTNDERGLAQILVAQAKHASVLTDEDIRALGIVLVEGDSPRPFDTPTARHEKWKRWLTRVERAMGHSADGNQPARLSDGGDGYSLDSFAAMFDEGITAETAATRIEGAEFHTTDGASYKLERARLTGPWHNGRREYVERYKVVLPDGEETTSYKLPDDAVLIWTPDRDLQAKGPGDE